MTASIRTSRAALTRRRVGAALGLCALAALGGCVGGQPEREVSTHQEKPAAASPSPTPPPAAPAPQPPALPPGPGTTPYPWHTGIVSTTFWVGEIFDAQAADGSQVISTYDSDWLASYGGCDGVIVLAACETETRSAGNGYSPTSMAPLENPFYLDLPFDDINDGIGFATRDTVVPWAAEPSYARHRGDASFSYLKNRWVQLEYQGSTCFGQIQDAGPGEYHDAAYVFGADDARPANQRYGGAGLDVSPAMTGCLGFPELDGQSAVVNWRFVDDADVSAGPWLSLVTTSQVR